MTLPASGPLSMSQVNVELGQSSTSVISLGTLGVRYLAGDFTGAIAMSQLYGQTNLIGQFGAADFLPGSILFNAIAKSSTQWVVVGTNTPIRSSTDTYAWTSRTSDLTLQSVAANGNTVIACGSGGLVARSTDGGTTWSTTTLGGSTPMWRVVYANGLFMIGNNGGTVFTSTDGASWTTQTVTGTSFAVNGIAYGAGLWVVVGPAVVRTSPDTITWTARSAGSGTFNSVAWSGSIFAAVGNSGSIWSSPDGITWTSRTVAISDNFTDVVWAGTNFVAVGTNGVVYTSTNGTSWSAATSLGTGNYFQKVTYDGTSVVGAGSPTLIAGAPPSSLSSWTGWQGPTNSLAPMTMVAANPSGNFVAVGTASNNVRYSSNGRQWRSVFPVGGAAVGFRRVAWNGSTFLAVGTSSTITATSSDGVTWTSNTATNFAADCRGLAWGNGLWVAVFIGGGVRTSPDGITWTTRTSNTSSILNGVAWSGTRFVAVGVSGTRIYSSDGITWVNPGAPVSSLVTFNNVAFASGSTWFAAASGGVSYSGVYASYDDGISWSLRYATGGWDNFFGVAFIKNAFYAVGANGQIFVSTDSSSWTQLTSNNTSQLNFIAAKSNRVVVAADVSTFICVTPAS